MVDGNSSAACRSAGGAEGRVRMRCDIRGNSATTYVVSISLLTIWRAQRLDGIRTPEAQCTSAHTADISIFLRTIFLSSTDFTKRPCAWKTVLRCRIECGNQKLSGSLFSLRYLRDSSAVKLPARFQFGNRLDAASENF